MPLDLGHDPAGAAPGLGLVAEAGVETPDLVGWTPHRALEQVRDLALENSIGGQADHIAVVLRFQEFVDLRRGKTRIGSEMAPLHRGPVTGDDRLQHLTPALGGVDVAGAGTACAAYEAGLTTAPVGLVLAVRPSFAAILACQVLFRC